LSKSISRLGIVGVTVSVEIADKTYGAGTAHFMSVSSRLPDSSEGLAMTCDEVIEDGLEKYLAAWQTLMQARLASTEITTEEYKTETRRVLSRIKKVKALYKKLVSEDV
jgi:hypothetical protein